MRSPPFYAVVIRIRILPGRRRVELRDLAAAGPLRQRVLPPSDRDGGQRFPRGVRRHLAGADVEVVQRDLGTPSVPYAPRTAGIATAQTRFRRRGTVGGVIVFVLKRFSDAKISAVRFGSSALRHASIGLSTEPVPNGAESLREPMRQAVPVQTGRRTVSWNFHRQVERAMVRCEILGLSQDR